MTWKHWLYFTVSMLALANLPDSPKAAAGTAPSPPDCAAIIRRYESGDTLLDFTALRLCYAHSTSYDPYSQWVMPLQDEVTAASRHGRYKSAVALAESLLQLHSLDILAHRVLSEAYPALGDTSRGQVHAAFLRGLVRSVLESGRGSVDSPYVVITVDEEYAVLGAMNWELSEQALVKCSSQPCDRLKVIDRSSQAVRVVYFDISLPELWLERALKK